MGILRGDREQLHLLEWSSPTSRRRFSVMLLAAAESVTNEE